ncbi:hypothetical protein O181_023650 [Austropuccinia psidii MF-1]|uniref:Uncharacterized protein n=1 Tax=Austropuccinia psidii MF-1 TaxID=1389203 RepID=A0A9Q3CIX8_9BASI|nr:hypothetical protein [Austropuccinia psidii MF-1]
MVPHGSTYSDILVAIHSNQLASGRTTRRHVSLKDSFESTFEPFSRRGSTSNHHRPVDSLPEAFASSNVYSVNNSGSSHSHSQILNQHLNTPSPTGPISTFDTVGDDFMASPYFKSDISNGEDKLRAKPFWAHSAHQKTIIPNENKPQDKFNPSFAKGTQRNGRQNFTFTRELEALEPISIIASDKVFSSSSTCSSDRSSPPSLKGSPVSFWLQPLDPILREWTEIPNSTMISTTTKCIREVGFHRRSKPSLRQKTERYRDMSFKSRTRTQNWQRPSQPQSISRERRRLKQLLFSAVPFLVALFIFFMITLKAIRGKPLTFKTSRSLSAAIFSDIEAPERDTLLIYRIVGNDLPPRHSSDQTLKNLQFILENESNFSHLPSIIPSRATANRKPNLQVKKFFVLNRIANETQLKKVEDMLRAYGIEDDQILISPFDIKAYQTQPFNWSPAVGWNKEMNRIWGLDNQQAQLADAQFQPKTLPIMDASLNFTLTNPDVTEKWMKMRSEFTMERWRALDFTYHFKNLYAMNNNGGRNFALNHGRTVREARWILPLDGNSFFTPSALYSLILSLRQIESRPDPPSHVVIPMSRILDNEDALAQNFPITSSGPNFHGSPKKMFYKALEEPQVGFRFNSREHFSEKMRYGRRSKLEFLWRLGAIDRSRNLDKRLAIWEVAEKNSITSDSHGSIQRQLKIALTVPETSKQRRLTKSNAKSEDFVRAGGVLRLFSGHKNQEKPSEEARMNRSASRMKGIITFLEAMDEKVARGSPACQRMLQVDCGFADWRLWSLDVMELEKLKKEISMGDEKAAQFAQGLTHISKPLLNDAESILAGSQDVKADANDLRFISATVFILSLTSYLLDDRKYAVGATNLIDLKFLNSSHFKSTTNAFKVDFNAEQKRMRLQANYDGLSYAFPISTYGPSSSPNWMKETDIEYLPFDPQTFDPTLLLDGVRLLNNHWQTSAKQQATQDSTLSTPHLSRAKLLKIFTLQISHLLLNKSVEVSAKQPAKMIQGLHYDLKLSALASFTDDVWLLSRIANRNQLRLPLGLLDPKSSKPLISDPEVSLGIDLYRRFSQGLGNVRLRPFDQKILSFPNRPSQNTSEDFFYFPSQLLKLCPAADVPTNVSPSSFHELMNLLTRATI